jgi:hypothetical protein
VARTNATGSKGKKKRETYFDVDAVKRRSEFQEVDLAARGNTRLPTKGNLKKRAFDFESSEDLE